MQKDKSNKAEKITFLGVAYISSNKIKVYILAALYYWMYLKTITSVKVLTCAMIRVAKE